MFSWVTTLRGFFRGPHLPGNAGRTLRFHPAYGVLNPIAGGILLNASIVANDICRRGCDIRVLGLKVMRQRRHKTQGETMS